MRRIILIIFFVNILTAQDNLPKEKLFIPWGDDPETTVKYESWADGRRGVQNFQVKGDSVFILDPLNQQIKLFTDSQYTTSLKVSVDAKDFLILNEDQYYCLANNDIIEYKFGKETKYRQKTSWPLIRKLVKKDQTVLMINSDQTLSAIGRENTLEKVSGKSDWLQDILFAEKISRYEAVIHNGSNDFFLSVETGNLASLNIIGRDSMGRYYIDMHFIEQEVPLVASRQVRIYSEKGNLAGTIQIPVHYYTYIHQDMQLDTSGILYHLVSSEDGVHVLKWEIPEINNENFYWLYPEKFRKHLHFNDVKFELLEESAVPSLYKMTTVDSLNRDSVLAKADTYVQHIWTANEENIHHTDYTMPDGDIVRTPSWVQVGQNQRLPYKWGGFDLLTEFDDGLAEGDNAGDINTAGVSREYARGVDCSGYVSQCWNLPFQYSTSIMDVDYAYDDFDGPVSYEYNSWDDLKPGDSIHRHGHVILFVAFMDNGGLYCVESAGSKTGYKVDYSERTVSEVSNYTPRYCRFIEGAKIPATVPDQPTLEQVVQSDSLEITWSYGSLDSTKGAKIQFTTGNDTWTDLTPGSLISTDIRHIKTSLTSDTEVFYRIYAANQDTMSSPSDYYGYGNIADSELKALIVDGFDRLGSYSEDFHSFAMQIGLALYEAGMAFETVANEVVESGDIILNNYDAVFWILGDESTSDETFSVTEQNRVKSYLEQGGNLFVSGSEIAWDLDNRGSDSDKAFFANYLKADYVADDSEDYSVTGDSLSIFAGIALTFDNGSGGIYTEDYPDVIRAVNGSSACLNYTSGTVAGIQYEGTFGAGTETGRLVYLGFPWETILQESVRYEVINRVVTFFDCGCIGIDAEQAVITEAMEFSAGYPNPFNNRVNFKLVLAERDPVDIIVYNQLGQEVRKLSITAPAINNHIIWNGRNNSGKPVTSGIYFILARQKNLKKTRSVVYLK